MRSYPLQVDRQSAHCSCQHRRDCQRATSSDFVINIWIEKQFVERTGTIPKSFTLKAGTGEDHEMFFCDSTIPNAGTRDLSDSLTLGGGGGN